FTLSPPEEPEPVRSPRAPVPRSGRVAGPSGPHRSPGTGDRPARIALAPDRGLERQQLQRQHRRWAAGLWLLGVVGGLLLVAGLASRVEWLGVGQNRISW